MNALSKRPRLGVHIGLIAVCLIMCLPALYALQVATLDIVAAFQRRRSFSRPATRSAATSPRFSRGCASIS